MVVKRFDVFRNPSQTSTKKIPYLLVVQSDLLEEMDTCVVLPLARAQAAKAAATARLNPEYQIENTPVVQLTQLIGAVPVGLLRKHVTNLEPQRDEIVRALDFLFGGI
ncbi:MAG TPA: CcdB family protein [Rudaea sp.]